MLPRTPPPENISDAGVILHLEVGVAPDKRAEFLEFCGRAFPVYESVGGLRMALYEDRAVPGRFDEVGYYRTPADYERSEKALTEDPAHVVLLAEWRALLKGPPTVRVLVKQR